MGLSTFRKGEGVESYDLISHWWLTRFSVLGMISLPVQGILSKIYTDLAYSQDMCHCCTFKNILPC